MIELYHGEPNGFALKALIALEEKGAQYSSKQIASQPLERAVPGFPPSQDQAINLEREGPVLVDGGETITGSFFMLEYIAETVPGPDLLPQNSHDRYQAQSWGQYVALVLSPFVCGLGLSRHPIADASDDYIDVEPIERRQSWQTASKPLPAETEAIYLERLAIAVTRLEQELAEGRDYFAGNQFSIADIDVFAMVRNLEDVAPGSLDDAPNLKAFIERISARPSVAKALAKSASGQPESCFLPGPEPARWG